MTPVVTVIVCTLAEQHRQASLLRAIASARTACAQPVQILVVVNGQRRSHAVWRALQAMQDIRLVSLPEPSLPKACLAGRRAVSTPFFCFLDDDDELLPGSLDKRLAPLQSNSAVDVVASNGYLHQDGADQLFYEHLDRVPAAPLHALFTENWLASCGALFRSDSVGTPYFENFHAYAEWTWLAFQLGMAGKTIAVVNQPTFRIHDTPGSASKTPAYHQAHASLHQKMLASAPPADIAQRIRRQIGARLHNETEALRRSGAFLPAWAAHLRSLTYPGGWRYLSFSRHLLVPRRGEPKTAPH